MSEPKDYSNQMTVFSGLVERIMQVDSLVYGNPHKDYIVRYQGKLLNEDSAAAYDALSEWLRPMDITPVFRWDGDSHAIFLMEGVVKVKPSDARVNLALFVVTLLSVMFTGALYELQGQLPEGGILNWALALLKGWPFAVSLLAILGAHEFGHYLAGRYHKVNVTLPYFIPMPFSLLGTMGAFISIKEPMKNRRALIDIALAGPLAGMLVAIPVLIWGLSTSSLVSLPENSTLEGNSILYLFFKYLIFGQLLPAPLDYGGVSPFLYWVRYFFTGFPFPAGGMDVTINSVALAGWAGLLVTSLNLIPAGQLDGGHIVFGLLGEKSARNILRFVLPLLVVLGFVWTGWWLWAVIVFLVSRIEAPLLDQITTLDKRRRWLSILAMLILVLTFVPVPF